MEVNDDQKNSEKEKQNSSLNESIKQTETANSPQNNPNKKEKPEKLIWGIFRKAELIEVIGLVINFGTLIVFICVSTTQINQTNDSINNSILSDSLNQIAIDSSLTLTKKSLGFAISSDSINKKAFDSSLAIADSSLKIASQNAKVINENTRIELRPYVVVDPLKDMKLFGDTLQFIIPLKNVGKTPAYKVRKVITVKTWELDSLDFNSLIFNLPYTTAIIGEGIIVELVFSQKMIPFDANTTSNIINAIKSGVYVGINIDYTDIWGESHYSRGYWEIIEDKSRVMPFFNDSN